MKENMATSDIATKAAKFREMAKDKALPQDVRNAYLDKANKLEEKTMKPTMAMGGMVKMAVGGMVKPLNPLQAKRQEQKAMMIKDRLATKAANQAAKAPFPNNMGGMGGMGGSGGKGGGMATGGMVGGSANGSDNRFAMGGTVGGSANGSDNNFAKGGMAKKPAMMNYGGMAMKKPMMAKGGAVKKAKSK